MAADADCGRLANHECCGRADPIPSSSANCVMYEGGVAPWDRRLDAGVQPARVIGKRCSECQRPQDMPVFA